MQEDSIVFLYNEKAILYDGKTAQSTDFHASKEHFTASIVPLKLLNTFSYKIANTTNDDEIAMQTELKMYTEGGLNADKEYIVDYIKYDADNEYLIEAFALSKENFDIYFKEYAKKVTAIDMVFPRFLAYQALYDEKLQKESNDLILYISETESFAALYQNGKYIGHRVMNSLEEISKRVSIEVVKLKEYLQTKGFIQSNYGLDEMHILDSIQAVLFKDIEKIMYSMNQKRTLFGFDKLHKVFIDFNGYNILGMEQFFTPYGYDALEINKFDFEKENNYGNLSIYTDYIYKLHIKIEEEPQYYQHLNFSFLERKKPIMHYLTVKYGLILTVSIIICLGIYIFFASLLSTQEDRLHKKQALLRKEKQKTSKIEKKLSSLKKEHISLEKKHHTLENNIFVYENTLSTIPLIQETKYKREKFMNDVLEALQKYRLNTLFIKQYDDKSMDVMLISESNEREHITKFIDELLKKHYHSASTKQISLDNNIYKSLIRIEQ